MALDWLQAALAGHADPREMRKLFPWAEAMAACPQDSLYHAEGDVWTHTGMVAARLEETDLSALPRHRQDALRLAAWFHDVAKPETTEITWSEEEKRERVRQPYHAPKGALVAWQALIDAGCDPLLARDVHALVFWHQRPTHMLDQKGALSRIIRFTTETSATTWADLLRFCASDQRGRISPNVADGLLDLELVAEMIREESVNAGTDLLEEPWPFATPESRLRYCRGPADGSPFFTPQAPGGSRVIILSGLPGSGKDFLARTAFPDLPVVSLDVIREEMKVKPTDDQGRVRQAGLAQARVHLRQKRDFVWNATCLSRSVRQKISGLALDYDARVEYHALDVPLAVAQERNARRSEPLPAHVIEGLALKREPIGADEAHEVWSWNEALERRPVFGTCADQAEDDPSPA
ncbi:AAA family ATPase [Cereibacter sphaeroides]|uniref:AAA family ATPase n=1 Tax=Cereibacter sphaeroides TaxID=1063 RepID=UPI001F2FA015|nr:AAA family ATPase [Cereibacter sphaeroides]MCE6957721.1 AAA family ATPase [Cereibacter sphaeroides]MCE6971507.1 AAA family ATPase [Cereibacter sphaeroides]